MNTAKYNGRRAFTLVELLVVIGILALFAGLLLPTYARATRNTRAIACLNNLEQINRGVAMYAEEHQNYFPQVWNKAYSGSPWWPNAPVVNKLGYQCGQEWTTSDHVSPETPAAMLTSYLPNNNIWVCPKRKRGSDYVTAGKLMSGVDPSISGYISYGFNEIGVFDQVGSDGNPVNATSVKPSQISQPSQMVAIGECSGGNGNGDPTPGSVWDTVWLGQSGPSYPATASFGFNYRFQTSYTRHNNRSNILYADGHVAPALPSSINYGQFAGIFSGNGYVNLSGAGGPGAIPWSNPVSSPALDSQEWSGSQE